MINLILAAFLGAIAGYILGHHAGWSTATDFWSKDVSHWRQMFVRADKHNSYLTRKFYD
jgi:membrane protein DedA with SNARE-associated domain